MIIAEGLETGSFVHQYLSVQLDPIHLLSELGFTAVFEVVQLAVVALLWRRVVHPALCREKEREGDSR
jgi:hypothetical protein